jgi:hypothetical protein
LGVPTGNYTVQLSLITPHVQLTSDGKAPSLAPYETAIENVLYKAARQAHARAARPDRTMSKKDAAWQVMAAAYLAASSGKTLPANARQIMYAARPDILWLTGKDADPDYHFNDQYFTQVLLPDYIETHPKETADWDVVFDDRGSFIEPHTGRVVGLGTLAVREYLGTRPPKTKAATVNAGWLADTVGPKHRFRNVLFIEKEGFLPLFEHAEIAELFDLAIMSTKGMSVTAARRLIDGLFATGDLERVLVLHDFDLSGFSIFGTLGKSNRRYRFLNPVQIIDLGLRLVDVQAMGLDFEKYSPGGDWDKRAETLQRHGATDAEIKRLQKERVELNAMTSGQFVRFVTDQLKAHGVTKLVPDAGTIERHARQVLERTLLNRRLRALQPKIKSVAGGVKLPADLRQQVEALLRRDQTLPWDVATARIVSGKT